MAKTATRSVELEPIDRLEEKMKLLVSMVERMKAEQARAQDENQRLSRELESLRGRLLATEGVSAELATLQEERDVIRTRVSEMRDARAARSPQFVDWRLVSTEGRVIPVEIHGQRYPIRSTLDPEYVARLALYVDEKMQAAADATRTGDPSRLAMLAALNIADELFRCRDVTHARAGELAERAGELERLLDRVLMAS
jgi:cell division protein ZapA